MSDEVESIPPPRLLDDRSMGARYVAPKLAWMQERRERLAADAAIDTINAAIRGDESITPLQIKSCEIALRKTLPDLTAVALGLADQKQIAVVIDLGHD